MDRRQATASEVMKLGSLAYLDAPGLYERLVGGARAAGVPGVRHATFYRSRKGSPDYHTVRRSNLTWKASLISTVGATHRLREYGQEINGGFGTPCCPAPSRAIDAPEEHRLVVVPGR